MKPQRPLFWHQGLFLQPQHFQQFDLYMQSLAYPLHKHLQSFFYGVIGLDIDQDELANNTLSLSNAELLFPDGTFVSVPDNAVAQRRRFTEERVGVGSTFIAYAGLRKVQRNGANVSVTDLPEEVASSGARFASGTGAEEVPDLHQSGSPAEVRFMQHVVRIFWESEIESLGDYSLLPLARLTYEGDRLTIANDYVPPTVSVEGSGPLQALVRSITDQIAARCRQLEDYKRPREVQGGDLSAGTIFFTIALQSLNRYVPVLQHLRNAPICHPWQLYGVLRSLAGELSTFSDGINALGVTREGNELLPEYSHESIYPCFERARALLTMLLAQIEVGPENVIPMEREGAVFKAAIPLSSFQAGSRYYLVIRTSERRDNLIRAMREIVKVSSSENMAVLVSRALPGVGLEYCESTPPGLPRRDDAHYFDIDQTGDQWLEIQKAQNICLYWETAPNDTIVELAVVRS